VCQLAQNKISECFSLQHNQRVKLKYRVHVTYFPSTLDGFVMFLLKHLKQTIKLRSLALDLNPEESNKPKLSFKITLASDFSTFLYCSVEVFVLFISMKLPNGMF
jgi:hypothetical protein